MKKLTVLLLTILAFVTFAFGHQEVRHSINNISLLSTNSSILKANKIEQSTQCLGTTKKGLRCRNRTLNASGYCYLHEDQNPAKRNNVTKKEVKSGNQPTVTKSGQTIYTGPRGGRYHYSKSGKKVYEKR